MKILITDDEDMQRELLSGFLKKKGYEVFTAANGVEALELFAKIPFQLVLLDHNMPGMTGDKLLAEMKKINPLIHAMMITAYGTVNTAVSVMKLGADDFLEKPIDLTSLLEKIRWIEQRITVAEEAEQVAETVSQKELPVRIIGEGPAIREVLSLVSRVALTPWAILIRGETGTGKELIARLIHLLSPVSDGPFVEVNCGAIPENLFESELFGHEKGAFTGAVSTRRGRFELAKKGTIFLDEIGELPLNLQPKLLRALQENRIYRVGGEKEISVDARVITATNRNLKTMVEHGLFREDLYYRLNVFDIELPPLRNRKEDIPNLVNFFLERYGCQEKNFDSEATTTLMKYSFPGNIRELEHIIQRTVTLARGKIIKVTDLPPEVRYSQASESGNLSERLDSLEKEMILAALEKNEWVQTRAALSLGISERVLRYKMEKYRISRK
jgi:two-component system response regulator AtoC